MEKWKQFDMEGKINEALSMAKLKTNHHFENHFLFLTPYQIAIALSERHPTLCKNLGMELGGAGTGLHHSLTQYIAQQLSTRIKTKEIHNIEGAFIANLYLIDLVYENANGQEIHSSNNDQDTLSMFRLKHS